MFEIKQFFVIIKKIKFTDRQKNNQISIWRTHFLYYTIVIWLSSCWKYDPWNNFCIISGTNIKIVQCSRSTLTMRVLRCMLAATCAAASLGKQSVCHVCMAALESPLSSRMQTTCVWSASLRLCPVHQLYKSVTLWIKSSPNVSIKEDFKLVQYITDFTDLICLHYSSIEF